LVPITALHLVSSHNWFIIIIVIELFNIAAASTDAECAFSEGWRKVNFMQHNMASQTFKAQMAVGSWDGTPLFPSIGAAICIMEKHLDRCS
jgi:hypothetical protein